MAQVHTTLRESWGLGREERRATLPLPPPRAQAHPTLLGASCGLPKTCKLEEELSQEELRLGDIIDALLASSCYGTYGRPEPADLQEGQLHALLSVTREVFLQQPALLELEAPLKVCGDVHGQFHDLIRLFDAGGFPPESNYLFLGDYVDRGKQSLETMALLLAYKARFPENLFLLRGNHECASISRVYGFYDECKRRYNVKLWRHFCDAFNCLPVCAVVGEKVICMHGGLSPDLHNMDQIRRVARPADVPHDGIVCDLLWADPDKEVSGWELNDRGISYAFGQDVVTDFLAAQGMDLVCRAHQVVEDGYEFFAGRQLITIFSAPNYGGDFNNAGGIMEIGRTMCCSFKVLRPTPAKDRK